MFEYWLWRIHIIITIRTCLKPLPYLTLKSLQIEKCRKTEIIFQIFWVCLKPLWYLTFPSLKFQKNLIYRKEPYISHKSSLDRHACWVGFLSTMKTANSYTVVKEEKFHFLWLYPITNPLLYPWWQDRYLWENDMFGIKISSHLL